ncbi:MAG: DUF1549 and DUF1553 domain-containing protein [Pirellulaceae bacterium]
MTQKLPTSMPAKFAIALGVVWSLTLLPSVLAEPVNANIQPASEPVKVAPLYERFANSDTDAVPDFQKHVVPLLGRLGCNGRACHGSFQGRGDFQLSLFGYDFSGDHKAMLDESTGRVDIDDVDESLILAKPSDADLHEGGKRFDTGTWQHHVLRRWVQSGAKLDRAKPLKLQRLEIQPSELQFKTDNDEVQLKAIAHWEDGTYEDVTDICRFSSNDDSIAEVDENGHVNSGDQGDTHLVVFYDNAVVPVPVLRPVATPLQTVNATTTIDKLIEQKLNKLGVQPSEICSDSEFIRRVSFDITGILPTGERVREFLTDKSPGKRQALVEELLESPGYSAWWATRFSDWTGNSEEQLNNALPVRGVGTKIWHEWLRVRLEANVPYDKIIEGIVEANNREEGESYLDYCKEMTQACMPGNEVIFAKREGMPLFWARRNFAKPEERAIGFAYTFLGVRIECAQCHKHPFDQWSKDDFDQFAKLFAPMRYNQNAVATDAKKDRQTLMDELTGGKKLNNGDLRKAVYQAAKDGKVVPFGELLVNTRSVSDKVMKQRAAAKKKGREVAPLNIPKGTILGGEPLELSEDPRPALMQWLRDKDNPYFAKAIVNRVWSNYFGIGIVNPTDDMNLANPPSNAPLLDHLATDLIAHDFDLKWLHREIASSDAYQRSANTNETNKMDRINFSHHMPRRLPAEVVHDSVILATGSDTKSEKIRDIVDAMAIADGKSKQRNNQDYALSVFGQSIRESNCDCDRSDSPSLLQTIYLRNDREIHERLADKDGWVAQACKSLGVPGPRSKADPRQMANEKAALAMRKQMVLRIEGIKKMPEDRQKRNLPLIEKQYAKAKAKFKGYGYAMPTLDALVENPRAWLKEDLQPASSDDASGLETKTMQSLVEEVYLRTLSRFPDQDETKVSVEFIEGSETAADGIQSLLWALVNTKEFIITH